SPALAAAMVGWMGAMQLVGRVFFVPVAAWLGPRGVTASVFAVQALALAQLPLVRMLPTLVPFVMMLGAANGMSTLARASSVAHIFGSRHYGAISGAMALGANGARAIGPVGASLLVLAFGSYERVFLVLPPVRACGLSGGVFVGLPCRPRRGEPRRAGDGHGRERGRAGATPPRLSGIV